MKLKILLFLIWLALMACQQNKPDTAKDVNPPAAGFNLEGSDPQATQLADQVMTAMGGRKAWDNTRYLQWNFFGARRHLWDKHTGWVRIDNQRNDLEIILNINREPLTGQVYKDGAVVTNQDSVNYYLERGRRMWINDSYWLVMPFKLKDNGVTLEYVGTDTTISGDPAEVIRLTFEAVGVTPQNAYHVWITPSDSLVKQWAYYADANDSAAVFARIWGDYRQIGNILLSGDRGNDRWLTEIEVLDEVPSNVFESFEVGF